MDLFLIIHFLKIKNDLYYYIKVYRNINMAMDYFKQLEQLTSFLDVENTPKTPEIPKEPTTENFVCKYCKSKNSLIYDYNYSNEVCGNCGIIYNKIIDESSETRFYGASDNKSVNPTRCGKPINPLLPKSSMGTQMSVSYNSKYKSLTRLHRWNQMPADERSLNEVFKKIDMYVRDTPINSKIISETKLYYKKLSEKTEIKGFLTRGDIRISLIAACLFVSCKNNNKPMREVEIAKIFGIDQSDVTKGLKKFGELEKSKNLLINSYSNNIHDFINKYCSQLNINDNLKKIVHLIYIRAKKINIIKNSNNYSICGGLLYFISASFELGIKKTDIIKLIKISEVTLNKIYKEFLSNKKILFIGFDMIEYIKN